MGDSAELLRDVAAASAGDKGALERVAQAVGPMVRRLALRFFGCPDHAADATQEALLLVVTRLDQFAGESAFTTWVYRVATNKFLSMSRSRAERATVSLEELDRELAETPAVEPTLAPDLDRELLIEEIKIGCTLAMLLCLDRDSRMAYILGAIAELDHELAAEILGVSPPAYRKRLQRARDAITSLMRARCGLFDEANACRCSRRIPIAIGRGRVDPHNLLFASSRALARRFPEVLRHIRRLEEVERAAALYRSHPEPAVRAELMQSLRDVTGARADAVKGDR
jgi:RNA polymerase sigma factor (sigma-70 family)